MPGADLGQPHLFEPPAPITLTLQDRFLVPPFSVLDARQGYWKARKQDWAALGILGELGKDAALLAQGVDEVPPEQAAEAARELGLLGSEGRPDTRSSTPVASGGKGSMNDRIFASGEGRGENLISGATVREGYGGDYDLSKGENAWGGAGTSIFDPVLCELVYRWYAPAEGLIVDPFAGGSVRGIVAAHLGRRYLGIDLRPEQVESNREQAARIGAVYGWPHMPEWVCGDAAEVLPTLEPGSADLIFSCPPYFDLEVYSDDPRDLSNADGYGAFMDAYQACIDLSAKVLKPDRFAIFVVGEMRHKKTTAYLGFVPDTIRAWQAAGLGYYNEGILVTAVGSLPIRTSALFGPGRKLGKTHQNILGFVKGEWKAAAKACPIPIEVAVEYGGATWRGEEVALPEVDEAALLFEGKAP